MTDWESEKISRFNAYRSEEILADVIMDELHRTGDNLAEARDRLHEITRRIWREMQKR